MICEGNHQCQGIIAEAFNDFTQLLSKLNRHLFAHAQAIDA